MTVFRLNSLGGGIGTRSESERAVFCAERMGVEVCEERPERGELELFTPSFTGITILGGTGGPTDSIGVCERARVLGGSRGGGSGAQSSSTSSTSSISAFEGLIMEYLGISMTGIIRGVMVMGAGFGVDGTGCCR